MKHLLKCTFAITALLMASVPASAQTCQKMHLLERLKNLSLRQEAAELQKRIELFVEAHPEARVIENVPVKFSEPKHARAEFRGTTNLLVISLHGKNGMAQEKLFQEARQMMGKNSISMPTAQGGTHLYTRFENAIYDYDYRWNHNIVGGDKPDGWNIILFRNAYRGFHQIDRQMMGQTRYIEPVISLSGPEMARMQEFMSNAQRDIVGTVGRFNMDGTIFNNGSLANNVPPKGCGNNCTSYLLNAPIMMDGQTLQSGLGPRSPYNGYIATNPGWLMGYLLTQAHRERVQTTILWTSEPLEQAFASLEKDGLTNWNFDPH